MGDTLMDFESSNDTSNQMKAECFLSEESNTATGEFAENAYKLNEENSVVNVKEEEENPKMTCYCGKERDINVVELQCSRCLKWFHQQCITINLGKVVRFMTHYLFTCKNCSSNKQEIFQKKSTTYSQLCQTAIANLICEQKSIGDRIAFSKDKEIIPFIDTHWEVLSTMPRRIKNSWHNTIFKAMQKDNEIFMSDNDPEDIMFALRERDLYKIGPNYDVILKGSKTESINGQGNNGGANSTGTVYRSLRGVKKKAGLYHDNSGDVSSQSKRHKSDLTTPKLPSSGYPSDVAFNKEGYRYVLAERDPLAPSLKEFEENEQRSNAIPPWLGRKVVLDRIRLSMNDRAPQLKISDECLGVTGEKGYCLVRATHAVARGTWYYEIKIADLKLDPEGRLSPATRLGWAQEMANLQTPLGFDKFGYSWRSRKGTKFHQSIGRSFLKGGFGEGDVLGCLIDLPQPNIAELACHFNEDKSLLDEEPEDDGSSWLLPRTHRDKSLIKYKSYLYFEEKDDINKSLKQLKPLKGSKIVFYKNGEKIGTAFEDIYAGYYYPAASLYRDVSLKFNFGPDFEHPPNDEEYATRYRPMHEAVFDSQIEHLLADIIYLIEHQSELKLDNFYDQLFRQ